MSWVLGIGAAVFAISLVINSSGGTHHSLAARVGNGVNMTTDHHNSDLVLLMNLLERSYTPGCLRVVVAASYGSVNSSEDLGTPEFFEQLFAYPSLGDSDNQRGGNINLVHNMRTMNDVKKTLNFINKETERVTSFSCVTYMLSRPPDQSLLPMLADPTTSNKVTRYFLVHTRNSVEAEQFLLDQRLEKDENVAALIQEENQSASYWRVLIRQLLHPSGSPQVLDVNKWSRDAGLANTETVFPGQMDNFYGAKLTGITLAFVPFIDYEEVEGSLVVIKKPCVDMFLMDVIADKLNFTYDIVIPASGQWGYLNDEGQFTGLLGGVQTGRVNFSLALSVTEDRARLLDFTGIYYVDPMTFITAKSRPSPPWRKLLTPFKGVVWACVVASVGVGALLYHLISNIQSTMASSSLHKSSSNSAFMQVLASFLCRSLHRYILLQAGKVFLGFWFLYGFLVTSHYSTALTSTLAVPFSPPTIDSLTQLMGSGLSYGMNIIKGSGYSLFSTSNVTLYKTMFQNMHFYPTPETMNMVAAGGYSFVYFKSHLELLVVTHNSDPGRRTDLHVASEEFFPAGYSFAVSKGAPYQRTFETVLKRCVRAGLIGKWVKDFHKIYLKEEEQGRGGGGGGRKEEEEEGDQGDNKQVVLTLDILQGPFFMLLLGSTVGIVVMFLETVYIRFS